MIESKWDVKEADFKEYINYLVQNKENKELSTYQGLKIVLEKTRKSILDNLKISLSDYFKKAISKYCSKNIYSENINTLQEDEKYNELVNKITEAFISKILLNDEQGILAIWASYGLPFVKNDENLLIGFVNECCRQISDYCKNGCLEDVLDEWFYICHESNQDFGEFIGLKKGEFLSFIKESRITIDLYAADDNQKLQHKGASNNAKLFFARCIGMSKDDDNINAVKGLQQAFNSPFAPFVFATTSMGQEGLDFHHYADTIVHWKLPSNPVDFEQREGRINRYHCLAIRKKVIEWWSEDKNNNDVYERFESAFKSAKDEMCNMHQSLISKCEMIPDWILLNKDGSQQVQINRIVPYFYLSRMAIEYNRNLKILQLYRTVIGQGNPEEIMERLMGSKSPEEIKKLFVDFSPYTKV